MKRRTNPDKHRQRRHAGNLPPLPFAAPQPKDTDRVMCVLLGGPHGERAALASGKYVWYAGEFYCHVEPWTGQGINPTNWFHHANNWLKANTPEGLAQAAMERSKVKKWMDDSHAAVTSGGLPIPMGTLIPIAPDRIGVHYNMLRAGANLRFT